MIASLSPRRFALRRSAFSLLSVLGVLLAPAAQASDLPENLVQAEILSGWVTKTGTRMAALHLTLAPGWKTYWRAPGDAGIPPSFNWSGSQNLGGVSYHWPSPEVFTSYGMRSVGYKDELILPIELHARTPGKPITLNGKIDLGICETICVPAHLEVEARLDGSGRSDPQIHTALANQPRAAKRAGVGRVSCKLDPIPDGLRLQAHIEMPALAGREMAFVEAGDPRIWVSEPKVKRKGGALSVEADLVPPNGKPMALDRGELRFTVIAGKSAVDIRGCATN